MASQVFVEPSAREAEQRSGKTIRYVITLKSGKRFYCGFDGGIIFDGDRKMGFSGSQSWAITGFLTRSNGHAVVPLAAAANGENIGSGLVCDLDHGTGRVWGSPDNQRAVSVELVDALTEAEKDELASRRRIAASIAKIRTVASTRLMLARSEREVEQMREFLAEIEPTLTEAEAAEVAERVREIKAEAKGDD